MTAPEQKQLMLLIGGEMAGTLTERAGKVELRYDDRWRAGNRRTPLSLSLPLAEATHLDPVVRNYLWGLLPDNEYVLERWARRYEVSAGNPFAMLSHVGEDCAGAAQFARPGRVERLLAADGGVDWIDESQIAERLRILHRDPTAWHAASTGQFSLAGAQAKTALHCDPASGHWGDPWGAVPTTHIIKPAVQGLDDHDLNEHLCLETARLLGLPAANSRICSFGSERAIVVERYDRLDHDGVVHRVHQEDLCQALGVSPTAKYQNDGGPGPEQIIDLLRREIHPPTAAATSVGEFLDALAFNWLIGGTDAHAKNYSLLLAGGQVRLAPMYDVASALPYDGMYGPKLRMAMRIGGEYRLLAVSGRHWRRFAQAAGVDPDATVQRLGWLASELPDALATAVNAGPVRALGSPLPPRLLDQLRGHAEHCRQTLTH